MNPKPKNIKSPVVKGCAKVPLVMQMEQLECGAAALAMVLAYYGRWVALEQMRTDCGVSRDGSNAKNILTAARSHGLNASGCKMEPEQLRECGKFPCIIHWNFNHFVVLNGFKGGKAVLNDPAGGCRSVSAEEFDKSFTGVCLMLEPGEDFAPCGRQKSMLVFAKKRLEGAGAAVAFVIITSFMLSLIGVITPAFSRVFLDRLLTGNNSEWLVPFIILLCCVCAVQLAVEWIRAVYLLRINGKFAAMGSTAFMWKVLRLPMEFFSQRMAGDISQRQLSNERLAYDIVNTIAPPLLNMVMVVFYLVVMLRYSVPLALTGVLSVLINLVISNIISKKRVNITRVQMRDSGKLCRLHGSRDFNDRNHQGKRRGERVF